MPNKAQARQALQKEFASCIWADTHLVTFSESGPCLLQGNPIEQFAKAFSRPPKRARLDIHYQGCDLLLLPPLPRNQSRMTWLHEHFPKHCDINQYVVAETESSLEGSAALLPKKLVTTIFDCGRKVGFEEIRLLALPQLKKIPICFELASGLWQATQHNQAPLLVPLPRDCHGTPPSWLKVSEPVVDLRQKRFETPLFCWVDHQLTAARIKKQNRKLLLVASLVIFTLLASSWLWLSWEFSKQEQLYVARSLERQNQSATLTQYQAGRTKLDSLYSELHNLPHAQKSHTHAHWLRTFLNACPDSIILMSVEIQKEETTVIASLTGFTPQSEQPLEWIKQLKKDVPIDHIHLVALNPMEEKKRKTDSRLAKSSAGYQFEIRLVGL